MRNWNRKTSSSKLSSVSISFSTAAKGNFNHNRRTNSKVPENVDPTRTAFNKILIDKDIRQVYKEVFGEALAEYNANQVAKKHPERQKKDYYSSICHDKKTEPFREAVVQIGNKDKQIPRWESNEILQKFLKKFQENNPQLVVVGAYIHNDEATPHMHIDYVPVATYSKGLKTRVSNDKALNQMGYKTWNDWKDSQMACLENLVREKGYDRPDIPVPEIKINPVTKSESIKFTKAEFEQIKQVIEYQQTQIASLEAQKNTLSADLKISKQTINRIKNKPYVLENERLSTELEKIQKVDKFGSDESDLIGRKIMNIKFADGIDIVIENTHIQKWSGMKSADSNLYLLSMDDGMYYLFDLNNKIIRKYDDFSKLPDILKNEI